MKNFKNTLAAIGLAAVLGVSTITANAGLLLSDRAVTNQDSTTTQTCTSPTGILDQLSGIIIIGVPYSITGLLLSDRAVAAAPCQVQQLDGLLLSDKK